VPGLEGVTSPSALAGGPSGPLAPPDRGEARGGLVAAGGRRRRGAEIFFFVCFFAPSAFPRSHLFLQGTQAPLHELVPADGEGREAMGYQGEDRATENSCRL
jgi:hypothetical protein